MKNKKITYKIITNGEENAYIKLDWKRKSY